MTSPRELISSERENLIELLKETPFDAPTLCEGWNAQHLAAHLLLREGKPSVAAGIALPPLAERTDRITNELAESLDNQRKYTSAIDSFAALEGPFKIRTRKPQADAAMNLIEYFVHIEDIRRAQDSWEPREMPRAVQEYMWNMLLKRAKLMAGKHFPQGLILKAPGFDPAEKTIIKGKNPSIEPTVLTGEPGELVLYLFGRNDHTKVTVG